MTSFEAYLECVIHSHSPDRIPATQEWLEAMAERITATIADVLQLPPGYDWVAVGDRATGTGLNHGLHEKWVLPLPIDHHPDQDAIRLAQAFRTTFGGVYQLQRVHCRLGGHIVLFARPSRDPYVGDIRWDIHLVRETVRGQYPAGGRVQMDHRKVHLKRRMAYFRRQAAGRKRAIQLTRIWASGMSPGLLSGQALELFTAQWMPLSADASLWPSIQTFLTRLSNPRTRQLPDPGCPSKYFPRLPNEDGKNRIALYAQHTLRSIAQNPDRIREFFPSEAPYCMEQRYAS